MKVFPDKAAIVIVASGRGTRAGGVLPKQYRNIAGKPLLSYPLEMAVRHNELGRIVLVVHADDEVLWRPVVAGIERDNRIQIVAGGKERQASVLNGLETLSAAGHPESAIVLVHDAARPFASAKLITQAIAAADEYGAAVPALSVTDTIKRVSAEGMILETLPRHELHSIQTPQAFVFGQILAAHRLARQNMQIDFTDDASLIEWMGGKVHVFAGETAAFKVTQEADFAAAERFLVGATKFSTRVATGYDVHAFGSGDHVWLGGVRIAHERGLVGHSDADPVLHALTDAVLGTIGSGDIGSHFPPSNPEWRGAASHIFLRHAVTLLSDMGGRLIHLDATIICEEPKIGPHREAMRQVIAAICNLPIDRISVKATTSERLGFTGRREGIAAIGTATIERPDTNNKEAV